MSETVLTQVEGQLGTIRLNRPKALNALDHVMLLAIAGALEGWRFDPDVAAVLFEGEGRAFCAGGDVRAVRQWVLDGAPEKAFALFAAEYMLDGMIAGFDKPVVAFGHGVVMGGGVGIAAHAGLRIAVEGAKYAMPEAGIGFFCDVGVNALLVDVPAHRALLFQLMGVPVGPSDAIALNLADLVVAEADVPVMRAAVQMAAPEGLEAIAAAVEPLAMPAGEAPFCALADRLEAALTGDTAVEIVAQVMADARGADAEAVAVLAARCPTSLEVIVQNFRAAQSDPSVAAALSRDLALARFTAVRPDFAEGVRAVLIDKDNAPSWTPSDVAKADRDSIADVLASADTDR